MAEVGVITSALRTEANKWRRLSDSMEPIKAKVADLFLDATAFYIGDWNTALHAEVYEAYRSYLAKVLGQAVVEFEQVADALVKTADEYDRADKVTELDLNKIYSA